jgi:hypothetical protein
MTKYIGFYWTLPVPWADFRTLPTNADSAAEKSLTIRYQRDRVRRWVREEHGELIAEEVFLELQPDRGSEQIVPIVEHLLARCHSEQAVFILVDFSDAFGWRRHGPLWDRLADERLCMPLDPAPITLNGEEFDPVEHFRAWREIEYAHASSKPQRKAAIAKAISELQSSNSTLAELAIALNAEGVLTPSGRQWTEDNLRKFLKSM